MEQRTVQQVGGGTYTVSLPKEWAEAEGIAAGTTVNLHTHLDGLLVVQVRERDDAPARRVAVGIDDADPAWVERVLRAAYAAGAERVTLDAATAFTDAQRRAIRRVGRDLTGVTVSESASSRATVRTLLDAEEVSIRQSVRQLRFVALSRHRDATAALTGDAAPPEPGGDDRADRLYALVDRHFARGLARLEEVDALGLTRPELFELRATARELERVADHAERLGGLGADPPDDAAGDVRTAARTARGIVDDAVGSVVGDAGTEAARRALAARDRLRTDLAALDRRLLADGDGDYRLARALDCIRETADCGGAVAELALRAAVRRGDLPGADRAGDRRAPTG